MSRSRGRFPVTERVAGPPKVDVSALGKGDWSTRMGAAEEAIRKLAAFELAYERLGEIARGVNALAGPVTERKVWGDHLKALTQITSTSFTNVLSIKFSSAIPARLVAMAVCDIEAILNPGDCIGRLLLTQATLFPTGTALTNFQFQAAIGEQHSCVLLSPGTQIIEPGYEYTLSLELRVTAALTRYDVQVGGTTRATPMVAMLWPRQKGEI